MSSAIRSAATVSASMAAASSRMVPHSRISRARSGMPRRRAACTTVNATMLSRPNWTKSAVTSTWGWPRVSVSSSHSAVSVAVSGPVAGSAAAASSAASAVSSSFPLPVNGIASTTMMRCGIM
ncbi:hypothetical protein C1Y40_05679 [Mycobacterium talmoniae]|uniref:Uncharacterized protein n=1 Tax=Mycobacterium talmoniae TaxID=1858794 RepID=A0A2S8BBZ2_9MYCO|nr:hypothetical protein C1Y40_05679 [Mycobacterium talmoniae]